MQCGELVGHERLQAAKLVSTCLMLMLLTLMLAAVVACVCARVCVQQQDFYTFEDLHIDVTPWSEGYKKVGAPGRGCVSTGR